jgi:hypothetical protein
MKSPSARVLAGFQKLLRIPAYRAQGCISLHQSIRVYSRKTDPQFSWISTSFSASSTSCRLPISVQGEVREMQFTTDVSVSALEMPPGKQEHFSWYQDPSGFGVRIKPSGKKTWVFQYRIKERQRRLTIGHTREISFVAARNIARKYSAQVRLGIDPAAGAGDPRVCEDRAAVKALDMIKAGTEPECYLYRHFHPNGDLLYVGISLQPLRRQDRHIKSADWRNLIHRIVIEPFTTREEALEAEQLAIRNEFPKFNAMHNGKRHPTQELGFGKATTTLTGESAKVLSLPLG